MQPDTFIDDKTLLDWCFSVGSLNFGVFGFVYSIYATASLDGKGHLEIVAILRRFCGVLAFVMTMLTIVAILAAWNISARPAVWVIIACFVVTSAYSVYLTKIMMFTPHD